MSARWRRPSPSLLQPIPLRIPERHHHWTYETWTLMFVGIFMLVLLYGFASGYWVRKQGWMDMAKRPEEAAIGIVDQGGGATPGIYLTRQRCVDNTLHVKIECLKDEALRLPIQP